jgi:oxygen-dependent protoporphyrinogen oxidase
MQRIKVVGAGFSGLVTAYFLTQQGCKVEVCEKSSRAGGLIKTMRTQHGLVETAANGLLNSARLEKVCADIGVPLAPTRPDGRKRFIFRGRPRQIPLKLFEILGIAGRMARHPKSWRPRQFETIAEWGNRVLGKGATDFLLTPALAGIYAGDPRRLSASLIFNSTSLPEHLRTNRPERGRVHGTVAPPEGMQQLIDGLSDYLRRAGVEFSFNNHATARNDLPAIVCLSAPAASEFLEPVVPEINQALKRVEMLSLMTVTCFYASEAATLKGFGCLFPGDQGFRARGVLFNNWIFEGRGPAHSETWIFGGALDPDVMALSDQEIAELVSTERERFFGERNNPLDSHVTRWPKALPHYSIDLERILMTLPPPPPNIGLVGNYLGRIGLSKILERAAHVAEDFGKQYGVEARPLGMAHHE